MVRLDCSDLTGRIPAPFQGALHIDGCRDLGRRPRLVCGGAFSAEEIGFLAGFWQLGLYIVPVVRYLYFARKSLRRLPAGPPARESPLEIHTYNIDNNGLSRYPSIFQPSMPTVPEPVLGLSAPLSPQVGTEASLVSPLVFAKVGLLKRCTATQDEETTDEFE